jgi:lysophospholipase L1-like esterase
MKILITGDSITEGKLGQNFLDFILEENKAFQLTNLGLGGDTLLGIQKRTLNHLKSHNNYDIIVIIAGHNDIIIPSFEKMTFIHQQIAKSLRKRGSIPCESRETFKSHYIQFLNNLKNVTSSKIIITTLGCLNEDLKAETNHIRFHYNQVIKEVALECACQLCDIGQAFDAYLNQVNTTNYFMDSLTKAFISDQYLTKNPKATMKLSKKRQLHLTIDGVHLNANGSRIYADLLLSYLN